MKKAFSTQRRNMIDSQIKPFSVTDARVLAAFDAVPREDYAPENKRAQAYQDDDLDLGGGAFLPEPSVHARLIQSAEVVEGEAALSFGSEYGAAILKALGARLVSEGPADLVVLHGAAEHIPDAVAAAVKEGGRLACFVRRDGKAYAALYLKMNGALHEKPLFDAFVPVLPGFEKPAAFTF